VNLSPLFRCKRVGEAYLGELAETGMKWSMDHVLTRVLEQEILTIVDTELSCTFKICLGHLIGLKFSS
jgi:hypothetical protein